MSVLTDASFALSLVVANFGIAIAARMPMITTTISSSMRVKPLRFMLTFLQMTWASRVPLASGGVCSEAVRGNRYAMVWWRADKRHGNKGLDMVYAIGCTPPTQASGRILQDGGRPADEVIQCPSSRHDGGHEGSRTGRSDVSGGGKAARRPRL